jgi:hypothetical protein
MGTKNIFNDKDKKQIEKHNLTVLDIETQLDKFRKGFAFIKLLEPATTEKGIVSFSKKEQISMADLFDNNIKDYVITACIPASGAATRMFKVLFTAIDDIKNKKAISTEAEICLKNIKKFAFYEDLKNVAQLNEKEIDGLIANADWLPIIEAVLHKTGLNLASKPKAFIPFHKYNGFVRTSLEEQINESLSYIVGYNNTLNIHFTISKEHLKEFKELTKKIKSEFENSKNLKLNISYSYQQKNTDTIAVDIKNCPIRDKKGNLVFRPGGHGALLQNLNKLKAEMVFLKNIDNIAPQWYREDIVWFKKVLGGYLIKIVNDIHAYLVMLEDGNVDAQDLEEMIRFAEDKLFVNIPEWLQDSDEIEKIDFLFSVFNRPIRVCGMVKNVGEPGGGPFFVEDDDGNISLQIVESSQIDIMNKEQKNILLSATHFNPVDLVLWKNDFKGKPFDLNNYANTEAGFIAKKSFEGKEIKAMELPGLWNGAMADWNTIFVEVPLSTFNPVKEISDLLRDAHQPVK